MSLLEEFQDTFHERMCRKIQIAHTHPENCTIEKQVEAGVSTPSRSRASSCTSIGWGRHNVFAGTVQSPSTWPTSMRGSSLDPGRSDPQNGKTVSDVETCVYEHAREKKTESHLHGKLERYEQLEKRPGRPVCNQGLSNKQSETPSSSMDGKGAGCVEIAPCMPIGGGDEPTRSAIGLRRDVFTQAAAICPWCTVGSDPNGPSRGPVGCDCGSTPVLIIQDPFSAIKRQLLTVDTPLYLAWARSSTIVNDWRQETDDLSTFGPSLSSHLRGVLCRVSTRSQTCSFYFGLACDHTSKLNAVIHFVCGSSFLSF